MTDPAPLRLAVYGFIVEGAGSVGDAYHLLVDRLLELGHQIDLYAIDGFVRPGSLTGRPGFRYFPVGVPWVAPVWRAIERFRGTPVRPLLAALFGTPSNRLHYPKIAAAVRRAHAARPYDALLALGLLAPFRVPGLRTVSWAQGTPNGEWGWFWTHPRNVAGRGLLPLLPGLAGLYAMKFLQAAADHPRSDLIIDGGRWTLEAWRRLGVPRRKLAALPYPIELDQFRPAPPPADKPPEEILFLHLGRLVPRKRIDLLVDGFREFARDEPGARLRVVGQPSYGAASDLRRLAAAGPAVEYSARVPRTEVPGLLARADCVVQPSEHENFGSAVAEALAAGRPVLVGPTNTMADYLPPTSVVFAEYTPAAVAAGMREIARRVRADRAGVAADSRRAAEQAFDIGRVTDRLVRLVRGGGG